MSVPPPGAASAWTVPPWRPATWRTRSEIASLFGDFPLVDPGLTWTPLWHPEEGQPETPVFTFDTPEESAVLAGVGRKP